MEPILPGQGKITPDRDKRVGIHLVSNEDVIIKLNGMISTDQTGRFPVVSQQGNQYQMILYNYDSNVILAEPCNKQRTGEALAETYKIPHQRLVVKSGVVPILQRLDNEASKIMISAIEERKLEYQLASSHDHILNPAERTIQTWKKSLY